VCGGVRADAVRRRRVIPTRAAPRGAGRLVRSIGTVVVSVVVAAGAAACSVGGAGDVVGVTDGPPAAKLTPPELDRRLLAAELLGSAWIEQTRLTFASGDEAPAPFDPATWCPAAGARAARLEQSVSGGGAMVELTEAGAVGGVHEVAQLVWSDSGAARFVETSAQAFAACAGSQWSGPDGETISMTEVLLPGVADGAAGARLESVIDGPDGAYVWSTRLAVVRVGSSAMVLRELDTRREGRPPRVSEDAWARLLRGAVARLARPGTD